MSTTAIASPGSFDDFRAWQTELDMARLDPIDGPKIPARPCRAAQQRRAGQQIAEGLADWRRTHDRRN